MRETVMHRAKDLFGPLTALAKIKRPGPSYREWHRFLSDCQKAGVAALVSQDPPQFATPLGFALLRRYRWLKDSEERGIPYEQAEQQFCAEIERDRGGLYAAAIAQERQRARALRERDHPKAGKRGDVEALFERDSEGP